MLKPQPHAHWAPPLGPGLLPTTIPLAVMASTREIRATSSCKSSDLPPLAPASRLLPRRRPPSPAPWEVPAGTPPPPGADPEAASFARFPHPMGWNQQPLHGVCEAGGPRDGARGRGRRLGPKRLQAAPTQEADHGRAREPKDKPGDQPKAPAVSPSYPTVTPVGEAKLEPVIHLSQNGYGHPHTHTHTHTHTL